MQYALGSSGGSTGVAQRADVLGVDLGSDQGLVAKCFGQSEIVFPDCGGPERQQMRALDENETATLLTVTSGTRYGVPIILAITGGLRRGEILALKWQDVDFESGRAVICRSLEQTREGLRFKLPKTDRGRRTVVLPSFTLDALRAHRIEQAKQRLSLGPAYQDNDLICPREEGSPWPPDMLSTAFAALVRRSDLSHVRLHDLRHTHATQLLKQGVHPKIVSERLGHSNIGITLDTYSHVLPGMQEDAVIAFDTALRSTMQKIKSD